MKHARRWIAVAIVGFAAASLVTAAPTVMRQAPQGKDTCVDCHAQLDELPLKNPVAEFGKDIHQEAGLGCVSCHGGDATVEDAEASMSPARGFIARPKREEIGLFCGKCHMDLGYMRKYNPKMRVDQWTEYLTSVHGQKNQAGDTRVATCLSCHGVHGMRGVRDPSSPVYPTNVAATCARCHSSAEYMASYGIATDQDSKYRGSVHAFHLHEKGDLSAPTCNDCHGNHGAAPPGVASVAFVCGQCHTRQQRLFDASPHRAAFEELGMAACMTCHENHAVLAASTSKLEAGDDGVCVVCHAEGETADQVREQMRQAIVGLQDLLLQTNEVLNRAARAGMEVSAPRFQLSEAHEKLIQARVLVHGVNAAELMRTVDEGLLVARNSRDGGQAALEEIDYRRRGLLAAAAFILLAAAGLYLKIRERDTGGTDTAGDSGRPGGSI